MKIIRELAEYCGGAHAVTLGKFDGVHLGHQQLIQRVLKEEQLQSAVFTFSGSPAQLFQKVPPKVLFTEEEKTAYLEQLGVEECILFPFTRETAAMEPEAFIKEILVEKLQAKKIVIGSDYRFGRERRGDAKMLRLYSEQYGYELEVVEKLQYEGEVISSTRIGASVQKGNMEEASAMLGRPYSFSGTIIHGKSLGHTMGVPTINMELPKEKLVPPFGVYCSKTTVEGNTWLGISNIGCKPTVQKEKQNGIETHLFDCSAELYGKEATVELLHHTRGEISFPSVETLKQQLQQDIAEGKSYFSVVR